MDLKFIQQLIKAVKESGFDKFEMTQDDFSIKLEKSAGREVEIKVPVSTAVQPLADVAVPEAAETPKESEKQGVKGAKGIPSPLVGVFHPAPKAVKIGDKLKKGDVLCIVEAMKLMNEVQMTEDGEIIWIGLEDGDAVEYGQLIANYA